MLKPLRNAWRASVEFGWIAEGGAPPTPLRGRLAPPLATWNRPRPAGVQKHWSSA